MNRFLFSVLVLLVGCGPSQKKEKPEAGRIEAPFKLPYQLNEPAENYTLPNSLKEISGLTYFEDGKLLCVQDEEAVVYVFDTKKKKVVNDFGFGGYGDFEGIDPKTYQPSGIAVHPITGEWYMITSAGKRLVITSRQAKIKYSEPLDPDRFRQPEGICFAPNGDLFIASEGKGKKGYILKFDYRR